MHGTLKARLPFNTPVVYIWDNILMAKNRIFKELRNYT